MALDLYQVGEFNDHWVGSYVKTPKGLSNVRGVIDPKLQTVGIIAYTQGGKALNYQVTMGEVSPLKLDSGYYNYNGHVILFQRVAHQGKIKGLYEGNTLFGICSLPEDIDIRCDVMEPRVDSMLAVYNTMYHHTRKKKENLLEDLGALCITGEKHGVALGRNYAIARKAAPNEFAAIPAIISLGGVVGRFTLDGEIVLGKKVSYIADSLAEEVNEEYGFEVKINVR